MKMMEGRDSVDINVEIAAAAAVSEIVEAVKQSARNQYECFAKCGKKYMDGPLSRSKDGFRKK